MDWSNERILEFLEVYQSEDIIWNPKHVQHKIKSKVYDAWNRISTKMKIPVVDLKIKKNSLMATFRMHLRRKKSSIKSGMGAEEVYSPIWFAYQYMENFLAPVYDCEGTINTENNALSVLNVRQETEEREQESEPFAAELCDRNCEVIDITPDITLLSENDPPNSSMVQTNSVRPVTQRQKRRQITSEINDAQKQIKQTFATLNNILTDKRQEKEQCECDLYGKLLAEKLKSYSTSERHLLMHEIDGLLLKKPPQSNVVCDIPNDQFSNIPSYITMPPHQPLQNSSFATAMYDPVSTQSPQTFAQKEPSLRYQSSIIPTFPQSPEQINITNTCLTAPIQSNTIQTLKPSQVVIRIPNRSTSNTTAPYPIPPIQVQASIKAPPIILRNILRYKSIPVKDLQADGDSKKTR